MSFRNYLRRIRETLTASRPAASQRRRPCTLDFDRLEDRLAPVVGFNQPPPVAAGVGWDGVVQLQWYDGTNWQLLCTGSLLSSGRHILTAAHCLTNANGQVNVPTTRVNFDLPGPRRINLDVPQADYRIHPSWRGWNTSWDNDLAILILPALAPSGPRGVGADRYDIYRSTNELTVSNGEFSFLGYGRTGNGNNGDNVAADGRKRLGFNRFERIEGTRLQFDFDNGTTTNDVFRVRYNIPNLGIGLSEAMNAPGDSGGPSFLSGRIATVTSTRNWCGCAQDILPGGNSSFGDWGEYTRTSIYAGWIDGILGGAHSLVLDMEKQFVGQDATPDTIELLRAGSYFDIYVNGQHYHRATYSLVNSIFLRGSSARDVFVVTDDLGGKTVVVDGRGGNDELILRNDVVTPDYHVFSDSVGFGSGPLAVYYSNVEQLTLNAGGELVNVRSTAAATPLTVSGAGRVYVGNAGRVDNVRGAVTVRNPPSYTDLTIDNSADPTTRTVTLTATGVTGLPSAPVNWVENDLRSLTIRGGNGLNTYHVIGTPQSSVAGGLTTTFYGGTGIDTVNVRATGGALTINGNGNLDVVHVGNAGSVQNVRGALMVTNPPAGGYTALTVDNSAASPATQTLTLSSASLRGLAPADISYAGGDLRSLNVSIGGNNSSLTVSSTPFGGFAGGVQTTVTLGSVLDFVRVWAVSNPLTINGRGAGIGDVTVGDTTNSLSRLFAALTINNARVKFMDQGTAGAQTVTVTGTGASRTGLPAIALSNLAGLEWNAGAGDDTFHVRGNPGGGVVINAGGGNDTIHVGTAANTLDGLSTVAVFGQGGQDSLTLHDEGADTGHSYALSRLIFDSVRRSGGAADVVVSYQGMTLVSVNAGGGDDTFVFGDGLGFSGYVDGGGGVNTLDYSAWTAGVYVDLYNYYATGAAWVLNIRDVIGGAGDDYLHGDYQDNWLVGNGGHDILVGDEGTDYLQGGDGFDQLYGGGGADWLEGGAGEDLLIDGYTSYDYDVTALSAIWNEWVLGGGDYSTRVANLRNGTGLSAYLLDANNVFSDGDADVLLGQDGLDWFWGTDGYDVLDRVDPDEVLN